MKKDKYKKNSRELTDEEWEYLEEQKKRRGIDTYNGFTREAADASHEEYQWQQYLSQYESANDKEQLENHKKHYELQKLAEESGNNQLSQNIIKNGQYVYSSDEKENDDEDKSYEDKVNEILEGFNFDAKVKSVEDSVKKGEKVKEILERNNNQRKVQKIIDDGR